MTREKHWKQLCRAANPDMQESSAAGYQLRRHYQKYLLVLECLETGRDQGALIDFAEKQKKKKKEKDKESPSPAHTSGSSATISGAEKISPQQRHLRQQHGPPPIGFPPPHMAFGGKSLKTMISQKMQQIFSLHKCKLK